MTTSVRLSNILSLSKGGTAMQIVKSTKNIKR